MLQIQAACVADQIEYGNSIILYECSEFLYPGPAFRTDNAMFGQMPLRDKGLKLSDLSEANLTVT